MTDKQVVILSSEQDRSHAKRCIDQAQEGYVAIIQETNRTIEQNAAQWPILKAFSEQLLWPVDGEMVKMTAEEWKDVLTAAFKKEKIRLAQGIDGGTVMIGLRTSKFGKREFSAWMEFLNYVAADRGVKIVDKRYGDEYQRY